MNVALEIAESGHLPVKDSVEWALYLPVVGPTPTDVVTWPDSKTKVVFEEEAL